MRHLLSPSAIIATILTSTVSPALSEPSWIDKKIDEVIENVTKPPTDADKPQQSGPEYRNPEPKRFQGPLIPRDIGVERAPVVRAKTFKERFNLQTYTDTVLKELHIQYPGQFKVPDSDATRYANIVIQGEFNSETDPKEAAKRVKKFVDEALKRRQDATDARAKAIRQLARRPTVTTSEPAVPQPTVNPSADLGSIASGLLAIGAAVAPMVPAPNVSGPSRVRVPAPNVRLPAAPVTKPSTITGLPR
jgi:hypothetical protein